MSKLAWLVAVLVAVAGQMVCADPMFKGLDAVPADAVVLFDGKDLSAWGQVGSDKLAGWKLEDGYMQVNGTGNIASKKQFGSCQVHVEYWLPLMADATGQARANSGVYLNGLYEVQVLDSYGLQSQSNDCGAIYSIAAPLVNACRPPEQWQSYDIVFHAPKFDSDGNKLASARLTVVQNGVLIQDNVEVPQPTTAAIGDKDSAVGPLVLQDHGCAVRYRNVWVRPL